MPVRRVFLDWNQPALPAVVRLLQERASGSHDFSNLVVVFPGRQASRRFLELLTLGCGGRINPPRIITVGSLPELLYTPQRPFASTLTQQLAWVRALRSLPPQSLSRIVRMPPEPDDSLGWLRLGELLSRQHTELAADGLRFADVARRGPALEGFDEVPRWEALAEVQARYLSLLDEFGLWDLQTARLVAIDQRECRTRQEILTVGTVDLNRTLRSMLVQVADHVTACIHAPEEVADRFDDLGCLIPAAWEQVNVEVSPEQMVMRDDPLGQCDAVMRLLHELEGQYALDDVMVAIPDESLAPRLASSLAAWGVPAFHPVEKALSATAPYRLLEVVSDFLDGDRSADLAALIRHPETSTWLDHQGLPAHWLTRWDEYYCRHLPRVVELMVAEDQEDELPLRLRNLVRGLLQPFGGGLRPLAAWSDSVREFFRQVYAARKFSLDSREDLLDREALRNLLAGLESHAQVPAALDPPVSAVEALRLTLHQLSRAEIYRAEGEPAVHLAGWLEAPLDDAPVAVVTTLNEGFVPSSANHDLFLPDRLRAHLGLEDNSRRYARDAHALLSLLHSRKVVRLICARRDSRGDPLSPSRLLLAGEAVEVARRVRAFYHPASPESSWAFPTQPPAPVSGFQIPRPARRLERLTSVRVTAFRDFLKSPYRFYLRYVQRLEQLTDDVWELDAANFGTLLHRILEDFGRSEDRHSTDQRRIERFLLQRLEHESQVRFGTQPLPAVLVQLEQSRLRLSGFARWQAQWRAQGWEIHAVERRDTPSVPLTIPDGRSLLLTGRLDRIDYHPQRGEWAIFDYKSSENPKQPDDDHRQGPKGDKRWVNLQLPLYRRLARALNVEGQVRLGYIALPQDPLQVGEIMADWSTTELDQADELALEIVRKILDQEFWEPLAVPCGWFGEFDDVCLQGVSGQEVLV